LTSHFRLPAAVAVTSVRLGAARFQYCPVGHRWALVRPVNDSSLTGADRQLVDRD